MGKRSRDKGKRGEREVARLLRPLYGDTDADGTTDTVRRGWQSRQGDDECDVEGTPWWNEVKRAERVNVWAAYEQAKKATDGRPVVVWMRRNGGPWLAVMAADEWLQLAAGELP